MELTPDQKGGIAELAIASKAALLGVGVSRPMVEGLRYDLIFDWHLGLQRVQCKGAVLKRGCVEIRGRTSRMSRGGYVRPPTPQTRSRPSSDTAQNSMNAESFRSHGWPVDRQFSSASHPRRTTRPRALHWPSRTASGP